MRPIYFQILIYLSFCSNISSSSEQPLTAERLRTEKTCDLVNFLFPQQSIDLTIDEDLIVFQTISPLCLNISETRNQYFDSLESAKIKMYSELIDSNIDVHYVYNFYQNPRLKLFEKLLHQVSVDRNNFAKALQEIGLEDLAYCEVLIERTTLEKALFLAIQSLQFASKVAKSHTPNLDIRAENNKIITIWLNFTESELEAIKSGYLSEPIINFAHFLTIYQS